MDYYLVINRCKWGTNFRITNYLEKFPGLELQSTRPWMFYMWISVSRFQFKNISNVSCRQIYVQRLWRRNDFTKSPEVPYFDCLNSRSLTVNRGFNRGIIILVGGRKANRKPENMNKFSFGHVHLPGIFNQVRYLKTYMFMTKKRTLLLFHGMI